MITYIDLSSIYTLPNKYNLFPKCFLYQHIFLSAGIFKVAHLTVQNRQFSGAIRHAFMIAIGKVSTIWRLAFHHLPDHGFAYYSQPAQLNFLRISSEAVDRFGLAQTEAGGRMIHVLNLVTQERDGTLGFDILGEKIPEKPD